MISTIIDTGRIRESRDNIRGDRLTGKTSRAIARGGAGYRSGFGGT